VIVAILAAVWPLPSYIDLHQGSKIPEKAKGPNLSDLRVKRWSSSTG